MPLCPVTHLSLTTVLHQFHKQPFLQFRMCSFKPPLTLKAEPFSLASVR